MEHQSPKPRLDRTTLSVALFFAAHAAFFGLVALLVAA